jgi:hypothetical protein
MLWSELRGRLLPQNQANRKIDMGNGRFATAADLLEGHFHRLATQTVTVQLKPDLQAAITVVAPELAPLTAVASEVAHAMPQVQPGEQFRQELHRALELTHRQHHAQRILGTRPPAEEMQSSWWLAALLVGVVVALLLGRSLLRRRPTPAAV